MEEVKIVAKVHYDIGSYRDACVWPYIEVGFSDPRFKNPASYRFLDQLPEGKGPTHYSQIPLEILDQITRISAYFTEEEQKVGEQYLSVLALVAGFFSEKEFTREELEGLLYENEETFSHRQIWREIPERLARADFLSRVEEGVSKGQFTPLKFKLTPKGLLFLRLKRRSE